MPIANFDLYVLELLNSGRVFTVHVRPPCSTASRAREKPLPRWIKDRGVKEPEPLRSETEPRGLRSLQGLDKLKVEAANSLYDFTAVVINRCLDRSVFFFLVNPRRSYLWLLPEFVAILSTPTVIIRNLQNCMFGGFRDKWTSIVTNIAVSSE